ncbi:MAG: hypothetical protein ACN6O6_02460 [Pseudomonas sp.]|uniref:hypothetical protein n=1 Tax=Pseudomonas sp. TaxID=306 RepID=UPI003D1261B5
MEPKGRKARIILGILIPTTAIPLFLLSISIGSGALLNTKIGIGQALSIIGFVSFVSMLFTLIPAVAYSLLMEYLLNPKINNTIIIVLASTLTGFLVGAQMYEYGWHIFGSAVGFLGGALLRAHFCYCQRQA